MIDECPGTISVQDLQGNKKTLRRFGVNHAETTLGVDIAPDSNNHQQEIKMYNAAVTWADSMRTWRISKSVIWTAIGSTIWRTLTYPLPALNLTVQQ
jgi:hypothetical protein